MSKTLIKAQNQPAVDDEGTMHKMLGEKHERNLMVLVDSLCKIFEDADEHEVKTLIGLLGRNQQGIGTCALRKVVNF